MPIHYKNAEEIAIMREAGRIVARCHEAIREAVRPGVSTWELDELAAKIIEQHDAEAAFLGYPPGSKNPFPASITTCINDELVHGIPSKDVILEEGDILSVDVGTVYRGFIGDGAFSMGVGAISEEAQRLLDITEKSLYEGIDNAVVGKMTNDISLRIQDFVERHGYNVAREYTGHGVGRKLHEPPQVPNWWPKKRIRGWRAIPLKPGLTFALEPMVMVGEPLTQVLDNQWTVVIGDGSLCAHFEHTIAVTDNGPLILTEL